LFLGVKRNADVVVPVGTKIYLNADSINKITARRSNVFDVFYVVVRGVADHNGRPLHMCSALIKESHPDMRRTPRTPVDFPASVEMESGEAVQFTAKNATLEGLTLISKSQYVLLGGIHLGASHDFKIAYKGKDYFFNGKVCHIHYNWKTHEHIIGITFTGLTSDQEIIMNLLIDPEYRIDISHKETIDPLTGRIMKE
jgi:hypothetical protein